MLQIYLNFRFGAKCSVVSSGVAGSYSHLFFTTTRLSTPSMSNSKKRSSPGADTTKIADPFADVDIGDAEESILAEYQKKIQRVELILGGACLFCPCTIT